METRAKRDIVADLKIDIDNLDISIIEQPSLIEYYGELWVNACDKERTDKIIADEVYDEKSNQFRKELTKSDSKVTEGLLKSLVGEDAEYKTAVNNYLDSKTKADYYGVVRDALKAKTKALELLVMLVINRAHSEVRIPKVDDSFMKKVGTEMLRTRKRLKE
jgi:hypothetical protein